MIFYVVGGSLDGGEINIPDMPLGAPYWHLLPPKPPTSFVEPWDIDYTKELYTVSDLGVLTFQY